MRGDLLHQSEDCRHRPGRGVAASHRAAHRYSRRDGRARAAAGKALSARRGHRRHAACRSTRRPGVNGRARCPRCINARLALATAARQSGQRGRRRQRCQLSLGRLKPPPRCQRHRHHHARAALAALAVVAGAVVVSWPCGRQAAAVEEHLPWKVKGQRKMRGSRWKARKRSVKGQWKVSGRSVEGQWKVAAAVQGHLDSLFATLQLPLAHVELALQPAQRRLLGGELCSLGVEARIELAENILEIE